MAPSDGEHGEDEHESDGEVLRKQEQALRRARKQAREETAAQKVHSAVQGPRNAKKKALENQVWLEPDTRNLKRPAPAVSKGPHHDKESQPKRQRRGPREQNTQEVVHGAQQGTKASQQTAGITKGVVQAPRPPPRRRRQRSASRSEVSLTSSEKEDVANSEPEYVEDDDEYEEEHDDLGGLENEEVTDLFLQEATTIITPGVAPSRRPNPALLFKSDENVTHASSRGGHPRRSASSFNSRTPTSESEGTGAVDHQDVNHNDTSEEEAPPRHVERPKAKVTQKTHPDASRHRESAERAKSASTGGTGRRPPVSQSRALEPRLADEDSDDEDRESLPPLRISNENVQQPKPRKGDAKLRSERPTISARSVKSRDPLPRKSTGGGGTRRAPKDENNDVDEDNETSQWPRHTNLQGPGLLDQNSLLRAVCRDAIKIVETTLVIGEAWPELHRVGEYRIEVLVQATKALERDDPDYRDIRLRIKKDDNYSRTVGKWVTDRLPHTRGPVRSNALDHIAVFQLGVDQTCIKRVQALFESNTYIFPGHWVVDDKGNPQWLVKRNQIYLNTGLINVLRSSFFSTPSSFGFKYKEHFVSSHPDRPEPELTVPLVALAATGIHAALDAWKSGQYIKKAQDKFDGDTYKTIFERHVKYLENIKRLSANAFHSLMSDLYMKVIGESAAKYGEVHGDPLAVLDLSGFE